MKVKNNFLNRISLHLWRVILAGVLLLTTVAVNAMPTRQVGAEELTRSKTGGLGLPIQDIDEFPGATISPTSLPFNDLNVDISGATEDDPSDPEPIVKGDCNSNRGHYTVWYNYNPGEQNAYISLDTFGSDYDTLIAVWTGFPGSLNLVACQDDVSWQNDIIQSKVKLFAQANTTYYIEIIKFAAPSSGLGASATGNTLNFHVKKINHLLVPPSLNFGKQLYRNMTDVKTVTYTNYHGEPVQLGALSITDSYLKKQTMFLVNNTCNNKILNYSESCTFGVAFRPWVGGTVTGKVTIPSNSPDQPHTLNLSGAGILGKALVKNLSFELDNNRDQRPDAWAFKNLTNLKDVRTSKFSSHQKFSMRLVGEKPKRVKVISQVINKKGVAGDDFYMQAWSKAATVPVQGARYSVYWYNGTKLIGKQSTVWAKGTYSFKTRWKAYTAPANYTRIVIKISYAQPSGTVWLDQVILRWAPSPK